MAESPIDQAAVFSQTCMNKWDKDGHLPDEVLALLWIVIREFKRIFSPDDVKAWDENMKAHWSMNGDPADPGDDAKAFASAASHLMERSSILPGLDSSKCVQNWGEFAAFAHWAAMQGTAKIDALSKSLKAGSPIPYTVDPAIRDDISYATEWAKPGQPGVKDQTPPATTGSWTPWIIGALAVAGVGTGAVFYLKHRGSTASQNPTQLPPSRWPYKATAKGMSAKWRSYTQYFKSEGNARDFIKEMIERHGAKSGELHDRRTNTLIEKV